MADSIPTSDADFNTYFKNIVDTVYSKTSGSQEWDFIPTASVTEFMSTYNAWDTAYRKVLIPHTPADTKEKNRVLKRSKKALRLFINRFLRYPPVTNEDRDNMGIRNPKEKHSPIPVPTTSPVIFIDTGTRRRIIIRYKDANHKRWGKPANVHGIEICWALLDHPPVSEKELIHSAFDTKSPLILEFGEEDRGKHIYLLGRWEIEREGEKGPSSAIEEAIIP